MGDFIVRLIEDYKYVDGKHFGERKHWLQDDYVKFIRLSESLIARNGEGILGFISNHGYLSNPTFRGMRQHLLKTFDRIYVLDLHGNANKKELALDGRQDRNVFDIRQGVAIIIAVKRKNGVKDDLASILHHEIYGERAEKYDALWHPSNGMKLGKRLKPTTPYYMFYPVNASTLKKYDKGFSISKMMPGNQKGIITARDHLAVAFTHNELRNRINSFIDPRKSDGQVRSEFFPGKKEGKYPPGDTRGWKLPAARVKIQGEDIISNFCQIDYRPFDFRVLANSPSIVDWPRQKFFLNMTDHNNFGILFNRGVEEQRPFSDVLVSRNVVQHHSLSLKEANNFAPLYLYPSEQDLDQSRRINFDPKLYARLQALAQHSTHGTPDEVAVFDYIYGVLHCPAYRATYAEFLKIDFPRIPWPASPEEFWDVSAKGTQLRKLHLMDPATIGPTPYPFKGEGNAVVDKPRFEGGKVWINPTQYFEGAPEVAWGFYIGGYQPAQKWLKDRKGRALNFDDVKHYQRILKILAETDRIMQTITLTLDAGRTD